MGARPAWALLALTLPNIRRILAVRIRRRLPPPRQIALCRDSWRRHNIGPLDGNRPILGHVPRGQARLRSGARPGDHGCFRHPGDAAAGLAVEQGRGKPDETVTYLRKRFLFPTPRMALGKCLRGYASACIDVSDGARRCWQAGACERLWCGALLRDPGLRGLVEAVGEERARELALTGGDDYGSVLYGEPGACREAV